MADPTRTLDPAGLIALANVVRFHENSECSCQMKCVCDNMCSCEMKCVCDFQCVCDLKDGTNVLDLLTNPVFRQVVQGLDVDRLKTIDDFIAIVADLRRKLDAAQPRKTPEVGSAESHTAE